MGSRKPQQAQDEPQEIPAGLSSRRPRQAQIELQEIPADLSSGRLQDAQNELQEAPPKHSKKNRRREVFQPRKRALI